MRVVSEEEVKKILTLSMSLSASRRALSSIRSDESGGSLVPSRIALPYYQKGHKGETDVEDWTLFKPAAYYPPPLLKDKSVLMGMKVVSVRSKESPSVPATIVLLDVPTGKVNAVLGATYLTAARTAAGSAIATEYCCCNNTLDHLVVFGAGLQAELHIRTILHVKPTIRKVTIVNRTLSRATHLKQLLQLDSPVEIDCVSLSDKEGVQRAMECANAIAATTNSTTPLFPKEWVPPNCHVIGVGSYTSSMEEVDSGFVSERCQVIIDTPEALGVGDLKQIKVEDALVGLLGDLIAGTVQVDKSGDKGDCTFYKSVGTAIQDIITAYEVLKVAEEKGIGTIVAM